MLGACSISNADLYLAYCIYQRHQCSSASQKKPEHVLKQIVLFTCIISTHLKLFFACLLNVALTKTHQCFGGPEKHSLPGADSTFLDCNHLTSCSRLMSWNCNPFWVDSLESEKAVHFDLISCQSQGSHCISFVVAKIWRWELIKQSACCRADGKVHSKSRILD